MPQDVSFNQEGSNICVVDDNGFHIMDTSSSIVSQVYRNNTSSFSLARLYYTSSLVILAGLGEDPKFPPRELRIVDIRSQETKTRLIFPTTVLNAAVNRDRLVVSLSTAIYIYNLTNMKLLQVIRNLHKVDGIISVSTSVERNLLAYPTYSLRARPTRETSMSLDDHSLNTSPALDTDTAILQTRAVSVDDGEESHDDDDDYMEVSVTSLSPDLPPHENIHPPRNDEKEIIKAGDIVIYDMSLMRPLAVIDAHQHPLRAVCLSDDGRLVATASKSGTIVRVFSTDAGHTLLHQFRRGSYRCKILCMKFSFDNTFLVVTSTSSTVHVFRLLDPNSGKIAAEQSASEQSVPLSREGVVRLLRGSRDATSRQWNRMLGGGSSGSAERHFAWFRIPSSSSASRSQRGKCSAVSIGPAFSSNGVESIPGIDNATTTTTSRGDRKRDNTAKAHTQTFLPVRVATGDGMLYTFLLDPEVGGECALQSQLYLLGQ